MVGRGKNEWRTGDVLYSAIERRWRNRYYGTSGNKLSWQMALKGKKNNNRHIEYVTHKSRLFFQPIRLYRAIVKIWKLEKCIVRKRNLTYTNIRASNILCEYKDKRELHFQNLNTFKNAKKKCIIVFNYLFSIRPYEFWSYFPFYLSRSCAILTNEYVKLIFQLTFLTTI